METTTETDETCAMDGELAVPPQPPPDAGHYARYIKPDILRVFGQTCKDPQLLGSVLGYVCGRHVQLSDCGETIAQMILSEMETFSANVEKKKERNRRNSAAYYSRKKASA